MEPALNDDFGGDISSSAIIPQISPILTESKILPTVMWGL